MIRHIFVFCLIFLTASSQSINAENPVPCSSNNREIQQLRIYELDRSKSKDAFDAFHVRFRDQALRIMKRHGFKVLDIWVSNSPDKIEYIYLLSWPNENVLESSWKSFLADQEWIAIKKKTRETAGSVVKSTSGRTLTRMDYSPACSDSDGSTKKTE